MNARTAKVQSSLQWVEWLNFFLANVQTVAGPFLAAYLAASGWNPGRVGYVLTFGGMITVLLQTPAGAVVDAVRRKRALLATGVGVFEVGAFLLMGRMSSSAVYFSQFLIAGAAPFLGSTVAAITLGIVGANTFDKAHSLRPAVRPHTARPLCANSALVHSKIRQHVESTRGLCPPHLASILHFFWPVRIEAAPKGKTP